jgi:hypothetical protein
LFLLALEGCEGERIAGTSLGLTWPHAVQDARAA